MMKNKTKKVIVNGVVLAALAAVGVTVYQLGTAPVKQNKDQDEIRMESVQQEEPKKTEAVSYTHLSTKGGLIYGRETNGSIRKKYRIYQCCAHGCKDNPCLLYTSRCV